ncbi:MAG: MFS transporter [Acidimicrobiales bacterium]
MEDPPQDPGTDDGSRWPSEPEGGADRRSLPWRLRVPPLAMAVVGARLISAMGAEAGFLLGLWGKAAFVLDGSATDLTIMGLLISAASMVGSALAGIAVDRFDARRVVLILEAAFIPSTLSMILVDTMAQLLVVATISWFAGAALETAIVSLPPQLVAVHQLTATNSRLESANWMALIIGPALAAPLVNRYGVNAVFVFDAATSVVAFAIVNRIRLPDRPVRVDENLPTVMAPAAPWDAPTGPGGGNLRAAFDGLGYAWRSRRLRLILYLGSLPPLAFGIFVALEPLYFRDVLHTDLATVGYVNALYGVGLLIGSLAVEQAGDQASRFWVLAALTAWSGVGGILYVISSSLVIVAVGAIVWSIPVGALFPLIRTVAQRITPASHTGRVMGALGVVVAGAPIVPVLSAPVLVARFGIQGAMIGSSALAILGVVVVWPLLRRLDAPVPAE